jgi:hypothetical protein
MKIAIEINLGNDAFHPDFNKEVGRILRDLAERLPQSKETPKNLKDRNGNTCGHAKLTDDNNDIFVVVHGEAFIPEAFPSKVEADEFAERDDTDYISGPWEIGCGG